MSDNTNAAEFTVSEISFALKRTVEDVYGHVRVRGEISGYRGPHSSGHAYFALKDDKARLEAVVWRPTMGRLRFRPEEGMEVIATGKLTTFPGSSKYQIVIEALEPAGVGALMAMLEERKKRLAAEGLFDPARKQLLPYLPRVIGVVTSPTGAVIRDILHRITDRFPVQVLVWPVRVQGETSGPEVAAGIAGFNAIAPDGPIPRPDVLIVARGGGSLEDLWGFNEEAVVRAAAASDIPLISAVGHETDWTLIDLAADVRAPTPTAAAEMAVPVRMDLLDQVDELARRQRGALTRLMEARRVALHSATRALPRPRDILQLPRQRFDQASSHLVQALRANTAAHRARFDRTTARLSPVSLARRVEMGAERLGNLKQRADRAFAASIERRRAHFDRLSRLLGAVSYTSVLARGFALVRDADGTPLRTAASVHAGQMVNIEFADGRVGARIEDGNDDARMEPPARETAPSPSRAPRKKEKTKPDEKQGSLF
ncbi:Exodeoxyribonuclease 7 large subunit [Hartmannibacter diazotrophicus]|uniref:Exodeoxyribonuclease 7 large subunit n=1 Tax=Hartmannibacter diazotrophicus TaxID=1482074 RepID=A0A2C9D2V2_9HYPH|nr:exodeoxyribonuclease VII large subunit [Hartmannibacter diazotrophicus]SON54519.1 Exodeoxyribonuclease 7 large subunit [Hartmannibacter diazotrophicus]